MFKALFKSKHYLSQNESSQLMSTKAWLLGFLACTLRFRVHKLDWSSLVILSACTTIDYFSIVQQCLLLPETRLFHKHRVPYRTEKTTSNNFFVLSTYAFRVKKLSYGIVCMVMVPFCTNRWASVYGFMFSTRSSILVNSKY